MTVVASMNLGLGILLIISSSMNDYKSEKYVLLGEIGMMVCILFGALFNQFSTFTATGPPAPFWAMVIFNLFFSIYGYYKGE
jgi:lipopolysaccharide export LptBFGC system permease protein LptF